MWERKLVEFSGLCSEIRPAKFTNHTMCTKLLRDTINIFSNKKFNILTKYIIRWTLCTNEQLYLYLIFDDIDIVIST